MVRTRIRKIKNAMNLEILASPELFVIIGFAMALGVLIKIFGIADFSSDWFWFITAIGLIIEGFILLNKKKRYNSRYIAIKNS